MNLSEKVSLAGRGYALTLPQKQRLARTLDRAINTKGEEAITVPEIQGMIDIVQSILPSQLYRGG